MHWTYLTIHAYAVSKSITGPYLGIDGANVTEGAEMLPVVTHPYKFSKSNGWVGFSHCTIFNDGNGNWYYSSQARLPKSVDNAIMLGHVRNIRWTKDGWPFGYARNATEPYPK